MAQLQKRISIALGLLLTMDPACGAPQPARATSPAELHLRAISARVESLEKNLPLVTRAAEAAAERLASGGRLWITGDEPGFAAEATGRAGGLVLLRRVQKTPGALDVVLVGISGADPKFGVGELRSEGALVIGFGSRLPAASFDFLIDSSPPPGSAPVAGILNVVNLWVFTAELVAALTRRGRMPAIYQSVYSAGASDRNARLGGKDFHPDVQVSPVPAGELGRGYLRAIRTALEGLRRTELSTLRRQGEIAAEAIRSGRRVWGHVNGHYLSKSAGLLEGEPSLIELSGHGDAKKHAALARPGDVFVLIGYCVNAAGQTIEYEPLLDAVRSSGARCIGTIAGKDGAAPPKSALELTVDPKWTLGDAVVTVPGYDVKILPASGVLQATIYWLLLAETEKALGKDARVAVPVGVD